MEKNKAERAAFFWFELVLILAFCDKQKGLSQAKGTV